MVSKSAIFEKIRESGNFANITNTRRLNYHFFYFCEDQKKCVKNMKISWKYYEKLMKISWKYYEKLVKLQQKYENFVKLQWEHEKLVRL